MGTGVNLCGVDIASDKIKVGQEYWGDAIAEVEFYTMDATDLRQFQTGQFDLAFSVCALEQMTYRLHEARTRIGTRFVSVDCKRQAYFPSTVILNRDYTIWLMMSVEP